MVDVPKKRGRPVSEAARTSGRAMVRVLDGEPVTVALLAAIAGITERQVRNRCVTAERESAPAVDTSSGLDLGYLARVYGRNPDPVVREWLKGQGVILRPSSSRRGQRVAARTAA